MNTFLKEIAGHYHGSATTDVLFVLPSKRAAASFRKEAAALGDRPRTMTIGEWEEKARGRKPSDRLVLINELYETYRSLSPAAGTLDTFIFWGGTLLSDFNTIDRYMAPARGILSSVTDAKTIGDDTMSFLTERQKEAMRCLGLHFDDDDQESVKGRFVRIWEVLLPLYEGFRKRLMEKGLSYAGMDARALAERIAGGEDVKGIMASAFPGVRKHVIIGLNALDACEKTVFTAMKDAAMAEFVWDMASEEICDAANPASRFVLENSRLLPPAFALSRSTHHPEVVSVSVPSAVGQAFLAPAFLGACPGYVPEETAFVLADEGLLEPLASAIPDDVETINVTMGCPVTQSSVYSLVKSIGALQLSAVVSDGRTTFHHEAVGDIIASPLLRAVLTEEEKAALETVKAARRPYVDSDDLAAGEVTSSLFRTVIDDSTDADAGQNARLGDYIKSVIETVGHAYAATEGCNPMELAFADRYCEAMERMEELHLAILPSTWLSVVDAMMRGETIPFEGVPLQGLQVMGTLETRALDFRDIAIVGANEGTFPRHDNDASFIPPAVRRAFGLPTPDYHDAIWAYHFYRLLQRSEHVWIIHDSRVDGLNAGEETRYVKQLEYVFGWDVRHIAAAPPAQMRQDDGQITKTDDDIAVLRNGHLSASAMQAYLECPAKFYYGSVKRLVADEPVKESLDAAMLGTVFHRTMEKLYSGRKSVTISDLTAMLADKEGIRKTVDDFVCDQVGIDTLTGRDIVTAGVIRRYVEAALRHDISLLKKSHRKEFRILGLERRVTATIEGFPFIGFIDRIDSYRDGEVRIVDYKTGHVENDDILIDESNAEGVATKLYGESNSGRPKIALQLYLYDTFAHEGIAREGETVVNSIYSTSRLLTKALPDVPESVAFKHFAGEGLKAKLHEIADTSVPWKRTCDRSVCERCDFRAICGR